MKTLSSQLILWLIILSVLGCGVDSTSRPRANSREDSHPKVVDTRQSLNGPQENAKDAAEKLNADDSLLITESDFQAKPTYALRTWTDVSGTHKVQALFVQSNETHVQIEKESGEKITLLIDQLSKIDQEYVAGLSKPIIPVDPNVIIGDLVQVIDGDTVIVLNQNGERIKVRLQGIDAPEGSQPYGNESRKALASLVFKKKVRVEKEGVDVYGRTLGHLYVDDIWINEQLIRKGFAWHYKKYSSDQELADAEILALKYSIGLWKNKAAVAPWDWRDGKRIASRPVIKRPPTVSSTTATVYVTKTGKKYHRGGCRYLSKSKIPISLSSAKARYGACSVCGPPQ